MKIDLRDVKTPAEAERRMRRIIADNRRVLTGLAHFDKGEKQPGCDCCYCANTEQQP